MATNNNKEHTIMCDRCKRLFHSYTVAKCKHEAVNKHYGENICMYCCMKCKHHEKVVCGVVCTLNK